MANVEKSVSIIFGGKDEISGVAKNIAGALGDLGGSVDKTADYLAGFAESMLKVEAAIAALAAGTLALAIKQAGQFGDQINEISTLTGATAGQIDGFREEIIAYSRDSKKSIDDINGAIYQAVSLGIDYKDSLVFIKDAERLAVAGRAELVDTTELLGGTLNAYGESVKSAAHYSDIFFETVRLGKTTIPELSQSLAQVTGLAANAGVPIETLSAAIAALTSAGLPTTEAVTGIKAAISNIIKPGEAASKMAKQLGIDFSAAALQSKGLDGVLREVYKATGGNVESFAELFDSTRALNAALTLGSDKSGKFASSMLAMQAAAGSTEKAYKKMADNMAGINQNLANNIKATLIDLGSPLLKAYGSVAEGIVEVFKGISISFDADTFQPVFDELNGFADKVSEFLKGVATALPDALAAVDFSPIINALKSLGGSALDFLDGFDPTKPLDLARAIQFVIDSISSMITVTGGMVEQFKTFWNAIKDTVDEFNSYDEATKKSTGNILALAIEIKNFGKTLTLALEIMNFFGVGIRAVFDYVGYVANNIGNLLGTIWDFVSLDWGKLGEDLRKFWKESERSSDSAVESVNRVKDAWWAAGESIAKSNDRLSSASSKTRELTSETEKAAIMSKEFDEVFGHAASGISSSVSSEIVPAFKKVFEESAKTKKEIEKLPEKLRIAIELQKVDTAQFEAETKRVSNILDFKARVDVSEIEAGTKKVEAMFDSVFQTFKDTGSLMSDLFRILLTPEATGSRGRLIEKQIDEESSRRDELLDLQRETVKAQVDMIRARTRAMDRGDAIIRVSGDGLAPYLEAFMWKILEAIQVRASQEGLEMLMGALA